MVIKIKIKIRIGNIYLLLMINWVECSIGGNVSIVRILLRVFVCLFAMRSLGLLLSIY